MRSLSVRRSYSFALDLDGVDLMAPGDYDALVEHGCGDAVFGCRDGVQYASFTRSARSAARAVGSAREAVESALPGARVVRVRPEPRVVPVDRSLKWAVEVAAAPLSRPKERRLEAFVGVFNTALGVASAKVQGEEERRVLGNMLREDLRLLR